MGHGPHEPALLAVAILGIPKPSARNRETNVAPVALRPCNTHRLLSSSFWGLPCRILNINFKPKPQKRELLWSLWVGSMHIGQCDETAYAEALDPLF